jgi:hypothetical protein
MPRLEERRIKTAVEITSPRLLLKHREDCPNVSLATGQQVVILDDPAGLNL